ncbi:hypothetical protein BVI2075_100029 [Burkholderia vietnamiensis]|nr:hypothetical protein BVI2075_100029 [Burkholderia vietnamiensis]
MPSIARDLGRSIYTGAAAQPCVSRHGPACAVRASCVPDAHLVRPPGYPCMLPACAVCPVRASYMLLARPARRRRAPCAPAGQPPSNSRLRRSPRRTAVDPQHDERAHDAQPARDHRSNRVGAEARPQQPGAERREGRAELVAGDDPAEHDGRRRLAEHVGGEPHGRRHGRDPVEPVEHREQRQPEEVDAERMRQIDQRQPAQPVVPEQQHAIVVTVGQPSRQRRAEQVEHAHRGQQRRALHFGHPVVAAHRDQVRADVAVGARAADEEAEEQQPEVARTARPQQRAERDRERILLGRVGRGRRVGRLAVRAQLHVGRPLGQQERDQRNHERSCHRDDQHHRAPAVALRDRGEHRQEYQLAGGRARGQDAHHEAAPRMEPARNEGRRQRQRDHAGRAADHQPPHHDHLPALRHHRRQRDARAQRDQRGEDRRPQPEALHRRRRERAGQPIQRDVDRNRQRNRRAAPAEFALERHHQHAGRRPRAGRRQQDQENHRRREPSVVKAPADSCHRPVHLVVLQLTARARACAATSPPGHLRRTLRRLTLADTWHLSVAPISVVTDRSQVCCDRSDQSVTCQAIHHAVEGHHVGHRGGQQGAGTPHAAAGHRGRRAGASAARSRGAVLQGRRAGGRRRGGRGTRGRQQDEPVSPVLVEGRADPRLSGADGCVLLRAFRYERREASGAAEGAADPVFRRSRRARDAAGLSRLPVRQRRGRVSRRVAPGARARRAEQGAADEAARRAVRRRRRARAAGARRCARARDRRDLRSQPDLPARRNADRHRARAGDAADRGRVRMTDDAGQIAARARRLQCAPRCRTTRPPSP